MANSEKERLDGFNAGYIIDKHRPELAKQLVEGVDGVEVPFVEGFVAGSKESVKERELTRSKVVFKLKGFAKGNVPRPTKSKGKDGKDKGFEIDI